MMAELYHTILSLQQKLNVGCAMNEDEDEDEERLLRMKHGSIIIPSKARTQNISIGNERDECKQKCEAEDEGSDTTFAELYDTFRRVLLV
jgi:hypothetical protein